MIIWMYCLERLIIKQCRWSNQKKFTNTKRKINGICKALSLNTKDYDPQKTVENIASYILSNNKLDRILYSEISNYVYSLEMSERGVFATNLEKLEASSTCVGRY